MFYSISRSVSLFIIMFKSIHMTKRVDNEISLHNFAHTFADDYVQMISVYLL